MNFTCAGSYLVTALDIVTQETPAKIGKLKHSMQGKHGS